MTEIVWTTPSRNASDSMPVGGYDLGLNLWVEDSAVLLYFGRGDSFDDNDALLKSGRLRLTFTEPVQLIQQRLDTTTGDASVTLQVGTATVQLEVICAVTQSSFSLLTHTDAPVAATVAYENWRTTAVDLPNDNSRWPCKGFYRYPGTVTREPDELAPQADAVYFWHANRSAAIVDATAAQQGLAAYRDEIQDTLASARFGGLMTSALFTGYQVQATRYAYTDAQAIAYPVTLTDGSHIDVHLQHTQGQSLAAWQAALVATAAAFDVRAVQAQSRAWWQARATTSFITAASPDGHAAMMTRNYALMRYMLLCNAHGAFPTKFNGGLFTVDPSLPFEGPDGEAVTAPAKANSPANGVSLRRFDPDFRLWGGGIFTAQNQRLLYWPMLRSGDHDAMTAFFELYRRNLPIAQRLVKTYWGHRGALFAEQLESFGLSSGSEYGWPDPKTGRRRYGFTDPTELDSPYTRYYYASQIELCAMILEYHAYSGQDISPYFELIKACLLFFYDHYQYMHRITTLQELGPDGKLVITPSTASESYKNATDPTEVISGLQTVLPRFMAVFADQLTAAEQTEFAAFLAAVPAVPTRTMAGHRVIAPAAFFTDIINAELPQLYPVFPYRQYGVGQPDLALAVDTWHYGVDSERQRGEIGWHQDNIFTAALGLTDEAAHLNYMKLRDGALRFPAFWGPGYDWLPDMNWGASGMIGLQLMLVQETDAAIYLLPAWPADWTVHARLQLEGNGQLTFKFDGQHLEILDYQCGTGSKPIFYKGEKQDV